MWLLPIRRSLILSSEDHCQRRGAAHGRHEEAEMDERGTGQVTHEAQQADWPVLRTPLCDLLGIEYPIVQSGMGGVGSPALVAAVCEAGGFGILAGLHLPAAELRERIRRVRALTSRPFGVNL